MKRAVRSPYVLAPAERKKRNARLRGTLQRFVDEGDAKEQQETGDYLMKALARRYGKSKSSKRGDLMKARSHSIPPDSESNSKSNCVKLRALLKKWREEEDPSEQKETGKYLMKALALSRSSNREPKV